MTDRKDKTFRTRGEAQDVRLRMGPDSWDEEARTLDLVWSTGADVTRSDWGGSRWVERLSMDPAHIRLERLNVGAPLLDTHRSHGASNVLGNIVPGSVRIIDGLGHATVRLTDAEDVASTVRKITDGSIRNISVGYRTHKEETSTADGEIEVRTATDWEPHEISVVPVPADAGAQVREMERKPAQETDTMTIATPAVPAIDVDAVRADGAKAERSRIDNINSAARALGFADDAHAFIADGSDVNAVRAALIEKRRVADEATATTNTIRVGASHKDQQRDGMENAIMHRCGLVTDLTDAGRAHRHMTLADIAGTMLRNAGVDTKGLNARDIISIANQPQRMALKRDYRGNIRAIGGNTTSDFPLLLANVANKSLLPGYEAEPLNFMPFVTDRNLPDFKQASVVNLGRITAMTKKVGGAEYNHVTIGESREVYSLATYGSVIGLSREAMINDDLGGFQIAIREMGAVWARTQLDLFWAIINDNANMGDGVALFSTATHANLGTGAALSKTTLAELRLLLREQKGVESTSGAADGQFLNLRPQHLIVPTDLEQTAEDLMGVNYDPTTVATARPGWVGGLQLTVEPRLGVSSDTAYYLAAARKFCERGLLGGNANPFIDNMDEWTTDEMKFKVRGDVAFKATDFRPITKNAGV